MRTILLASLTLTLSLGAQGYVNVWTNYLDYAGDDYSCAVGMDGKYNVYVGGRINTGTWDMWTVVKYSSNGATLWMDTIPAQGSSGSNVWGIAVEQDGDAYVTGYTSVGDTIYWLTVKYDPQGNIVWGDTIKNELGRAITLDKDGNVYAAGNGGGYWITIKYDSTGNILWKDSLQMRGYPKGIVLDDSNNLYLTGVLGSYVASDMLTLKYNTERSIVWMDTIDVSDYDNAEDIAVDRWGNLYVTGYVYNSDIAYYDPYTIKYDAAGNVLWIREESSGLGYGVGVDTLGKVYVAGAVFVLSALETRWLFIQYDTSGNLIEMDTLDQGDGSEAWGIDVDQAGNYALTGYALAPGTTAAWCTDLYLKYRDVCIDTCLSPLVISPLYDYTPIVRVHNGSYEITEDFDVNATTDTSGVILYSSTYSIDGSSPGDTVDISLSPWSDIPHEITSARLRFTILHESGYDMVPDNDVMSITLYIRPVIDSAVAYDGTTPGSGIDDDDYVALYFSHPMNQIAMDASSIDSLLSLSGGHTWLDGSGLIGNITWSADGKVLYVFLTTTDSPPTISVGDTITPDDTLMDIYGFSCIDPVVITGSFGPAQGVLCKEGFILEVADINTGRISFIYTVPTDEPYRIILYGVDGRLAEEIKGEGKGTYHKEISHIPPGVYFLRLEQGEGVISRRVILLK
ncbi:hypothetical protein DRQ16_04500 [bacterium]|nr:MAG: hypothetical protein DRQ16_04500 [bacterium]